MPLKAVCVRPLAHYSSTLCFTWVLAGERPVYFAQIELLQFRYRLKWKKLGHESVVGPPRSAGFEEMVKFLKRSSVRVLLVEKTDRLNRNLKDYVTVDELDLEIHFVKENVARRHDIGR
ncbi:MAG TPA: recombinase family protein [Pyrinomonadaceae bacterium]